MERIITLIGEELAKEGITFQYIGPLMECRECKLKNVCFNLQEGKFYRIKKVRDKKHDCKVHSGGVVISVEVEEVPIDISIPSDYAIDGSTVYYKPVNCTNWSCENIEICNPMIKNNTKLHIVELGEKLKCPLDKDLVQVKAI